VYHGAQDRGREVREREGEGGREQITGSETQVPMRKEGADLEALHGHGLLSGG
jgi:hypothetical protein